MEWISVKDRLPEFDIDVLLLDDWEDTEFKRHTDIRVGYLSEYTVRKNKTEITRTPEWRGTEFTFNITHWMPLPPPPTDKQDKP